MQADASSCSSQVRHIATARLAPALFLLSAAFSPLATATAQDDVAGQLLNLHANGAWSWFEDERAILDPLRGRLLVSSCGDASGISGSTRNGDIDIAWLDLAAGRFGALVLSDNLEADDHNSAALMLRPDGRYLAMYGMHGRGSGNENRKSRFRISTAPGEPGTWIAEGSYTHPNAMSYSNLFHLADSGRTYNFVRAINWDPNVMISTDLGASWTGGGKLLTYGGGGDRPYVKYASNGRNRIDLITTETHPRNLDTSIYHGYVQNDQLFTGSGSLRDADILDASGTSPTALTTVFAAGTLSAGIPMRHCWTIDIHDDGQGQLRALFQARANGNASDHRLFFAHFDGINWGWNEVCRLGGFLYSPENDYTGLAALAPNHTDTIYVSTEIDPTTGAALAQYELFEGTTSNMGQAWTWSAITANSSCDNLRPIAPSWDDDRKAVLWLRGTYSTYTNYNMAVVGLVEAPEMIFANADYIDATTSNTALANGIPSSPTGPAAGQGANDNQWHVRTGFGNAGDVWTASETGSENAPMLRTQVTAQSVDVPQDVWLLFWSNPNDDWRVRAGFAPTELRTYAKQGAQSANPARFNAPLTVTGNTVRLYSVWLGRARANALGQINVYIDDEAAGQSQSTRTWYDGIALAPVAASAATQSVGTGCNGSQTLAVASAPTLGSSVTARMLSATPGSFAAMQFGGGDLTPLDLGIIGAPGCLLYVSSSVSLTLGAVAANGQSPSLSIPIPNNPALAAQRFAAQGWTLDAMGELRTSPAIVLQPGL